MSDDETEGKVTEEIFECTIRSFSTRTENKCTGAWRPSFLKGGISNHQKLFGQSLVSQRGRSKNWHSEVSRCETVGGRVPDPLEPPLLRLRPWCSDSTIEEASWKIEENLRVNCASSDSYDETSAQLAVAAIWHIYKEQAPRPNYVKVSSFLLYYSVFF